MRYHILFVTILQSCLLCYIYNNVNVKIDKKEQLFLTAIIVCYIFCAKYDDYMLEKSIINGVKSLDSNVSSSISGDEYNDLYNVVNQNHENPTVAFWRDEYSVDVPQFATLKECYTILTPTNLSTQNVEEYVKKFNISFVYSSNSDVIHIFQNEFVLNETEIQHLYEIN